MEKKVNPPNTKNSGIIKILTEINSQTVEFFRESVKIAPQRYAIEIKTQGGSLKDLYEIKQIINHFVNLEDTKHRKILYCSILKEAFSAGLFLAQFAPFRLAYNENSKFFLHRAKKTNESVSNKSVLKTESFFFDYLSQRSGKSVKWLHSLAEKNIIIDAHEALSYRFIDGYL